MLYSPILKKAMAEIKAILEKHDIAGVIVLHTFSNKEGFAEHLVKIDPTYSIAKMDAQNNVRFRAKLHEDFKGNSSLMNEKIAGTANMLNMLALKGGELSIGMMELSSKFDTLTNAEHGKGRYTSQQELDN